MICPSHVSASAIHFAPVTKHDHVDHPFAVHQIANDPPFADAIDPRMPISLHCFAAVTRIALRDLFEDIENPALNRPIKLAELTL